MRSRALNILLCILVLGMSIACSKKGRVIPASKLTDIYAEMFLADQWLSSNYNQRKRADTSLFYAPIFEKYGYTTEDYDASVHYYITKPDEYAKILKQAGVKLDKKAKWLKKVEDYYNNREVISPYIPKEFVLDSLMINDTMMTWRPNIKVDTCKININYE